MLQEASNGALWNVLRRLLRHAKGLEGCSKRRRTAPSGTSFEAASRRLRTRAQAFGSGSPTGTADDGNPVQMLCENQNRWYLGSCARNNTRDLSFPPRRGFL